MACSVMVVDDDPDIRETVALLLEEHGFPVVTAADGGEALAHLRRGVHPGLILLDLMMPGMNGLEFRAEQTRAPDLAEIPVVIMSGDGRVADKAGALGLPWLVKPLELSTLLATADRFCRAPSLA